MIRIAAGIDDKDLGISTEAPSQGKAQSNHAAEYPGIQCAWGGVIWRSAMIRAFLC